MFVTAPLSSRNELPKLLNDRGLTGTAVEVGTHRGAYARIFLAKWEGQKLFCVDPWEDAPGYEIQSAFLPDRGSTREDDYKAAAKALRIHPRDRWELIRMTSAAAAARFVEWAGEPVLDFAYLDGDHSYEATLADLKAWWGVLKPGGILAGHDVVVPGESRAWSGFIQSAIADFIDTLPGRRATVVHLIVEEGQRPWSFYVEKPE